MKKIISCLLVIMLSLSLVACGSEANITSEINSGLNRVKSTITNIKSISNDEIVISDILAPESVSTISRRNKGTQSKHMEDKEVSGYPYNTNYNRNIDTYGNNYYGVGARQPYMYNRYGNVGYGNGYYGGYGNYGGYGGYGGFGNGYYGGYGSNVDTYANGIYNTNGIRYGYNRVNGANENNRYNYDNVNNNTDINNDESINNQGRFQSNINTYKDVVTNVNTYTRANKESKAVKTALDTHYDKLSGLCNIQNDVASCNNDCNSMKSQILASISYLLNLSNQVKDGDLALNDNQISTIKDFLSSMTNTCGKLNVSKNEVNTELASVKALKINYSSNANELSSKYVRLLSCLDTRCSYLQSILSCLLGMQECMIGSNCIDGNCVVSPECPNCYPNCPDYEYNNQGYYVPNYYEEENIRNQEYVNQNENYTPDATNQQEYTKQEIERTRQNIRNNRDYRMQKNKTNFIDNTDDDAILINNEDNDTKTENYFENQQTDVATPENTENTENTQNSDKNE